MENLDMILLMTPIGMGIAIFFLVVLSIFILVAVTNRWSKAKWRCSLMGWHIAPTKQGFDGCSLNGACPRCGKEVMQDSQGNWF